MLDKEASSLKARKDLFKFGFKLHVRNDHVVNRRLKSRVIMLDKGKGDASIPSRRSIKAWCIFWSIFILHSFVRSRFGG